MMRAHKESLSAMGARKQKSSYLMMRVIYYDNSTVTTGELQTSRGRKEAIASFASAQTGRLQEITGEIIVEGILAGGILAVHRHAFEAVDSVHCPPQKRIHFNQNIKEHFSYLFN
jgi:hypothetical protein